MAKDRVANLYNPHEQSKEQLLAGFVARRKVFEKLFRDLKTSTMQYPEQHILIEGQRGSGKTTLLLRLNYAIENDEALNKWLIPIVFKEEAYYGISDLAQLWEATAQSLEEKNDAFAGLSAQMAEAYDDAQDYERLCFEKLVHALESHGQKLVLFIDNFGELLQGFDALDDKASHRFREVLMTCPHLRVVGATAVTLEASFRYGHAFYEFFKLVRLEGLDRDEMHTLLLELAKANDEEDTIQHILEHQPGRVESLRILTGGVIRTIVLLFEILTNDEDGTSMTDLEQILDRVTPLYKHRMDDLEPHQRAVINAIALNWDAISPDNIARKTRRNVDDITAVLGELEKVFLVQRAPVDTQQDLYYLRERFFNIWYLMRVAPKRGQIRVIWLVRFLENWYGPDELHSRAKQHIQAVTRGYFQPQAAYYLTEALARTGKLDMETEYQMKSVTRQLLLETDKGLAAELSQSDQELLDKSYEHHQNREYEKALDCLLSINNKNGHINFGIGISYNSLRNYQKAEQYYLKAVELSHAGTMHNLALLYFEQRLKKQEALHYAQRAVEAEKSSINAHTLACIYVWNDQIENAIQSAEAFMADETFHETFEQDTILYLMLLLAKQRYADVAAYFERKEINLQERLKPLYYAFLYLSEDQDYPKLPPELSEPVHDIIERVGQLAVDYT